MATTTKTPGLESIDRLLGSGLLNPYVSREQRGVLQRAKAHAQVWSQNSPGIGDVSDPGDHFGFTLAAGDFNGDGNDDLAIAAPAVRAG